MFFNGMLAEEYVLQVEDLLVLYLKGCSANMYNFKQALLCVKTRRRTYDIHNVC